MSLMLRIRVISAKGLYAADVNGKSDPYCTVQVGHEYHWINKINKTHKKKETLSPEWNETFDMSANSQDKDVVKFSVLDHDLIGSDETLGFAELPITSGSAGCPLLVPESTTVISRLVSLP
eukprot:TRINITY_DN7650_c0_g1_i1.p1 TRINITY_DN7650_c0_g1~~TRINITY_DN7650_c0_g1_i1.p1  ORF type:complete len:121 (-),score=28.64 TRINITY_DN7650_c0_g1_i1:134-496(-)